MKKLFKTMLPLLAMAFMWTACSDDDEQEKLGTVPTIELGEATVNADNTKAMLKVTPSENTEKWYWKSSKDGQETEYTAVTGNEEHTLEIGFEIGAAYVVTVYAENGAGKSQEAKREFSFTPEDLQAELIELEIKNLSPFSMDVEVKKSAKCANYAIAAFLTKGGMEINDEGEEVEIVNDFEEYKEQFIESAVNSLKWKEGDLGVKPYETAEGSKTFTESNLKRHITPEFTYTIAVYAVDAEENAKVYTKEFTAPATEINGNIEVTINAETTFNSIAATFTAGTDCAKLIMGHFGLNDKGSEAFKEAQTDNSKALALLNLGHEIPEAYTQEITKEYSANILPNTDYIVYVIAIDKDGKVGKVVYKEVKTKVTELDGTGEFLTAAFGEQVKEGIDGSDRVQIGYVPLTVTVSNNVESVRIYCNSGIVKDINLVMADELYKDHYWKEYTKDQLTGIELDVILGSSYYVMGVTVDTDGKISEVKNLVTLADETKERLETTEEEEVAADDLFGGTGKISISITDVSRSNEMDYSSFSYVITKGENTQNVYVIPIATNAVMKSSEIVAEVETRFENFASLTEEELNSAGFSRNQASFNAEGKTEKITKNGAHENYPDAGSAIFAFITVDDNKKLDIPYIYKTGADDIEKFEFPEE